MSDSYSETYAEARQKFLSMASQRDAKLLSAVHPTVQLAESAR